ncbi:hypothetical protein [Methanobrevibacter thaueri]|uniref:Uncharacterized protein n=1 Tax=Methanobrevibacter thaueri TaxID=190975 RepID=A0A315XNF0_9EURY|nr:hypothetical protein [Methanobrevibacter thaueri]PWB87866.1 hypothetical protein MBBTH_04530 [Methanobrevibacter thaueri]
MKKFRITINPRTGYEVSFMIEEFEDQSWKIFDYYYTTSQEASSRLIWEREQCSNGVFDLIIIDNRPYFTMV